jgi:hypothetical protein
LCVIKKPRGRGGHSPLWTADVERIIIIIIIIIIFIYVVRVFLIIF